MASIIASKASWRFRLRLCATLAAHFSHHVARITGGLHQTTANHSQGARKARVLPVGLFFVSVHF